MSTEPSGLGATPDCEESLKELYEFLDGELTVERRSNIRVHLEGCQQCYEAFDFEAELRIVVSTRCREQVPDSLREKIADALRQVSEGGEPAS